MKYSIFLFALLYAFSSLARTYSSSDTDAVYIATLKAVVDYKTEDAENLQDLERLRQDRKFDKKLKKMLKKLNNKKLKTGQNQRIYNLLVNTGRKIYNELD